MEQNWNIFKRLSAIQNELTRVAKNLNVGVGATSYKGVGEADVLAAVKPLEEKYGVYSYPHARTITESGQTEKTNKYNETRVEFYLRLETQYRFVNIDSPSEYIDITSYGCGIDPADKAVGKAMTYCDKYALMKAYKIITGDDPDQEKSEESTSSKNTPYEKPERKQARPKAEEPKEHDPRAEALVKKCGERGINPSDVSMQRGKTSVYDLDEKELNFFLSGKGWELLMKRLGREG